MIVVFLRALEYCRGLLFLTTNRIGDFDEAFASRIQLSLYYPLKIFKLNFHLIQEKFRARGKSIFVEEDIVAVQVWEFWKKHREARWNGRQIRNACHTALALAEFEAQRGNHEVVQNPDAEVKLQKKNFTTVLNAYLDFMRYMKDIYGVSAVCRYQSGRGDNPSK
jgi:hypothetical protein